MGLILFGKGTRAPMSLGLAGGYPGCNVGYSTFRHGNVGESPRSLEETSGATSGASREDRFWGAVELEPGDIQYVRFMGGGGYADPLDREPEAVLEDVRLGLVSDEAATGIYGTVVDREGNRVDAAATRELRLRLRSERAGRPVGSTERVDVPPTGMRLSEYLQRTAAGETQCTFCGDLVAETGVDWKDRAVQRRSPVAAAGPHRSDTAEFVLIESFCPGCGTALDVELAGADDPALHDRVASWPETSP
jgi:N-methylhydantoinase B